MLETCMRYLWLAGVLGACGGGSSESLVVKIGNTKLAAVRDGETWKTVKPDAAGGAKIDADGPTALAIVCDDPGYFNFYTLYLGPGIEDPALLDFSCPPDATANVTVTISSTTSLDVYIGTARSANGLVNVAPGVYDVIAIEQSMPPRFEIRRGVSITSNMLLTFSLATTGTSMVATQVDLTGTDPADVPMRVTQLTTKNRTQAFAFAGNFMFPVSALQPGDRQSLRASTTSQAFGQRSHTREIVGTEAMVRLALPPYLTSVSPTSTSATSQGGAAWNRFYYGIGNPDATRLWDALMYPEWIEAGGERDAIRIPDPTGIPGWQPAWSMPSTAGFRWFYFAMQDMKPDFFEAATGGTL